MMRAGKDYGTRIMRPARSEYDPKFVKVILAAAAAKPEASFDNVADLLEWLDPARKSK